MKGSSDGPDPIAVLDAIADAVERVNGRGTHPKEPPLDDVVWYDEAGNLLTRGPDGSERYVMVEFERPLMEKAAEVLCRSGGEVLNVGFGCGLVDEAIQRQKIRSHTIVEGHPTVLSRMREQGWDAKPNVTVLADRWENVDWWSYAARFDGIFYDSFDYGANPLAWIHWSECVLKSLKPDTGVLVLYGPQLDRVKAERMVANFRRPAVLAGIDTCVVDVPFVVDEWRKRGVGRHVVEVFSFRIPSR